MGDLVRLGPQSIPGEVVAITDGHLPFRPTNTPGGLKPGDSVVPQGFRCPQSWVPVCSVGVRRVAQAADRRRNMAGAGSYTHSDVASFAFTPTVEPGMPWVPAQCWVWWPAPGRWNTAFRFRRVPQDWWIPLPSKGSTR